MPLTLTTLTDLAAAPFDDIIDVRSPAEFAEDHVPGAINLPALSDTERAEVGTIYVQSSRFQARKLGAAYVARNVAMALEGPLADRPGAWRPLLYCWRGGQRSGSFATILSQIGWRAEVVAGGYQSYRRLVVDLLHRHPLPHRLILLDGPTGTGKTALLHAIADAGGQMLDLEGAAGHRGSIFGALGVDQPAQKRMESRLAQQLATLDPQRPTFVEAESARIGALMVPPRLWEGMRSASRIHLTAPMADRVRFTQGHYDDLIQNIDRVVTGVRGLARFHSSDRIKTWTDWAQAGQFAPLIRALLEQHYDPRYHRQSQRHAQEGDQALALPGLDEGDLTRAASALLDLAEG